MQRPNFNIDLILLVATTLILNVIFNVNYTAKGSSDKISSKKCKCPEGKKWNGKKCVKKTGDEVCFTLFDPVCGCDGITYSNSCNANLAGIKKFTKGECHGSDRNETLPIQVE